jgi:mannose-6-phosphate isomerase-like protein (cupin superfamily)
MGWFRWAVRGRGGARKGAVAVLVSIGLVACSLDDLSAPIRSNDEVGEEGAWVVLDLQNVLQRQAQSGATFYRALTGTESFEIGVLRRRPADVDAPIEHPHTTMYRVLAGSGSITTASDTIPFEPGHIIFVREGVEHRFERASSIVDLLVVFALGSAATTDPELRVFGADEVVAERDGERNVFTQLVDASTMSLSMYMIPKNGDDPIVLEHAYDEVKIVIEGGGRFDLGQGGLEAEAGTIAFITSGTRHQFRRASDALDVIVIGAK